MKKRMNTLFFGICFIAALIAEAYCFQVLKGDLFSVVGIGIVVLITGYLVMDSIRTSLKVKSENIKFYIERYLSEEIEKRNERYSELANLQKATYTAIKKNTAILEQQAQLLLHSLEELEENNIKELQRMTWLHKKSLEGQKNSLNMEIHYNKENTKQIINALHEEGENVDIKNQIAKILKLLEENNELLKSYDGKEENNGLLKSYDAQEENIELLKAYDSGIKNASEPPKNLDEEYGLEAIQTSIKSEEQPLKELEFDSPEEAESIDYSINVTPLYEDPNKQLTTDEIAALFASVGK
jgi:hypothetical protein